MPEIRLVERGFLKRVPLCALLALSAVPVAALHEARPEARPIDRRTEARSLRVVQATEAAAAVIYPVQRRQRPKFDVGDRMPDNRTGRAYFPGMDLPRLGDAERYVRTDEFVYRIDTKTRLIREVIPIAAVILR